MSVSLKGKEKIKAHTEEHLIEGGFLIDMDGVIYHNSRLIPGADRFVDSLIQNEIPFLFVTNNSQRTRRDLVMKLKQLGIEGELPCPKGRWASCFNEGHQAFALQLPLSDRRCHHDDGPSRGSHGRV